VRAIVMTAKGGPEVLELRETPWPEPRQGELLVRVMATSVNPIDVKLRSGNGRIDLQPPAILGYDVSGVVEETGHGVRDFRPGDAVFYTPMVNDQGTYADYHVVPETMVAPKPVNLSHVEAAALPLAGSTAWDALMGRAGLGLGDTVLIHAGAGGVGSLAIQIAHAAGARVLATCRPESADLCHDLGAAITIDYRSQDFVAATLEATQGRGVDVTLDTIGGDTLARSLLCTRPFGRLVTIVNTTGDLGPAFLANQTVHFLFLARTRATIEALRVLAERGQLRPVIDRVLPLEEAANAHRLLEAGGMRGKIVLTTATTEAEG